MRITLRIDGGLAYLPGLARPRTLDVDSLPRPERDRMCALVDAARASAPAPQKRAAGAADARTYTLDIDDGGRCTTLKLAEPIADPQCSALVQALRDHLA